ncbi:pentapeptide repeat-containing protein, partial [Streptomyces sp. NPDC093510]|uniref:pentapeptide repeat-containing protein n=1 Tax=Streptomyces sp. NPDC093510 TaxID=3155199 RepID=UPI003435CF3D
MSQPSLEPAPAPPWQHCQHGADPASDPVGCPGILVSGHTACLAHLANSDRDAYLAGLSPGADIDHRGTPFTRPLLAALLNALRDPATGYPRLGYAVFASAAFKDYADFASAAFENYADFGSATFKGDSRFTSATFKDNADFASAAFEDYADFGSATFKNNAGFGSVTFERNVGFESVTFERASRLGPLVCAGQVSLFGAVFGGPVSLWVAARRLECRRTRWSSTAEVRLRHATVDFTHAVFEYPLTIGAEPDPFVLPNGHQVPEEPLTSTSDAAVRIASLRGVDAAHLVLADVDLSECLFTGTVHLDQLRLEGACLFNTVPRSVHWRRCWHPARFTRRRTLVEEHHWRARQPAAAPGWQAAPSGAAHVGPLQLAPVYRALRKAFEDAKHEPGAADSYYGEMGAACKPLRNQRRQPRGRRPSPPSDRH